MSANVQAPPPLTTTTRNKPNFIMDAKFDMEEIRRLSEDKKYGGSCLRDCLAGGDSPPGPSQLIGGRNGEDNGLVEQLSNFLSSIVTFVTRGFLRLRWYVVIAIDNVFPDMTAMKTWIYKLSSAQTPVATLKELICAGYDNFLSLFDWALQAFPARSDEIEAARLSKERFQQCSDLLDQIESWAVSVIREVLVLLRPAIDYLSALFNEALGYAGGLVGKLCDAMNAEVDLIGSVPVGLRQILKQTTRLLFFSCSMVVLAQQTASALMGSKELAAQVTAKTGKKPRSYIASVIDFIGIQCGQYLRDWMTALQNQLRSIATFFAKVTDRVASTQLWTAFGAAAQFMAEKFATVEDAVQTVVSWIVKVASRLKDRILSFLNAMISGGIKTIMGAIRKFTDQVQMEKPPVPEDELRYLEFTLANAGGIETEKRREFRVARDAVEDHLDKTREKLFKSQEITLLSNIKDQVSIRWELCGLVTDIILEESVMQDVSSFEDLKTKLFGTGFRDAGDLSLPEEVKVAYYRTMLDALSEDLETKHARYATETVRSFRFPAAWPGPEGPRTSETKIASNGFGPEVTEPGDDDEEEADAHSRRLKRAKDNAAMELGRMLTELIGVTPLELQASDQKDYVNKIADVMEADILPKPGEVSIGRSVIFNRRALLAWYDQKGRSLESITWARIAYEWILQNSDLLLFVRRGLKPEEERERVKTSLLLAMAVFGSVFLLLSWKGISGYNEAQAQLNVERRTWWDSLRQENDLGFVDELLGEDFDHTQDPLTLRQHLREKKNALLKKLSGMGLEDLKKKENLGWFNEENYGTGVSFKDVFAAGFSLIPFVTVPEATSVDNLVAKLENAVETISEKYINNDKVIFGSLGDWIWARIRGFLLTLTGPTFTNLLAETWKGIPIGSVGLAVGVGGILAYIAYHIGSAYVIWAYTGDITAFQEAAHHAWWIMTKVLHLTVPALLGGLFERMFGQLTYLFSAWGTFATLLLAFAFPKFAWLLTVVGELSIRAVHQMAVTVSLANGDPLVLDPRLSGLEKTRKQEQKQLLEKVESVRIELAGIMQKESLKRLKREQDLESLSLTLKQNQQLANSTMRTMILPLLMPRPEQRQRALPPTAQHEQLRLPWSGKTNVSTHAQAGDVGWAPSRGLSSDPDELDDQLAEDTGLRKRDLQIRKLVRTTNTLRQRRPSGKSQLVDPEEWLEEEPSVETTEFEGGLD